MQNLQSAAPNADAQPTVSSVSGPARVANAPSESSYAKMPKGARMCPRRVKWEFLALSGSERLGGLPTYCNNTHPSEVVGGEFQRSCRGRANQGMEEVSNSEMCSFMFHRFL